MNRIIIIGLLLVAALTARAQERTITGMVTDKESGDAMLYTAVQLLRPDSSYVLGATTDGEGRFALQAPQDGRYIVRASGVGYADLCRNVNIKDAKDVSLGTLALKSDTKRLKELTVTAQAAKVVLKEDTFVYNASAYRVAEGSTVEALVKKLPGAEVSDDGTIKINGKEVKKILVDGKEFMTGDTKTALKNLPTSIIEKVKAYDQQSDLTRVTGIDDGDEQTVLDFGVKPGMNKGMFGNADLSIGTQGRYSEKVMAAYFNDKWRLMGFGEANNVNDMGFGGGPRGGFGQSRQGLNASKMAGLNFNYEKKDKLQFDGSVRWNHSDGDAWSRSSGENFVATMGSFSNRLSQAYTRSNSWDARFRLEWQPTANWNIMLRPSFNIKKSDGQTVSRSATFNTDPYESSDDPLSDENVKAMAAQGLAVNSQRNTTITYGDSQDANVMLQVNRKLGAAGRNVTLRAETKYSDSDSKTFSTQDLEYFQLMDALGGDSTYQAYRYNLMPTKNWGYNVKATYSEPIVAKHVFVQASYQFAYGFSKSDRATYDFSSLGAGHFDGITPAYRSWNSYLALVPGSLDGYFDQSLSRYSEYKTYTHDMQLQLRFNYEKWRMNVGVMLQPQHSTYVQDYLGVYVDTARNVVNWSPTFDFRYRFNKQSNLRINYRGTATQPTMSQLLDITDDTDPQNISLGNPGLKPSFQNNFRLFYNNYVQSHFRSLMTFVNFSTTRNAIGNSVYYDSETGARTTRPVNINGNWNLNAALMYNMSIDTAGVWNVNTFTKFSTNRYASELKLQSMDAMQKNITRSSTWSERLSASYRISWLEVELDGSLDYTHTKNDLQPNNNLNTWQFAYGANVNVTLPWGTSLSTDFHNQSRRGYNDASLNTNELLWNAQLSQGFLSGKPLTVSVQFYDILHQQSNLSRTINSMSRTDTEYNSINSYVMFKASYRFNLFGSKQSRQEMQGRRGPDGERMGPPPGRGNGGFGGGRPGGGFGRPY